MGRKVLAGVVGALLLLGILNAAHTPVIWFVILVIVEAIVTWPFIKGFWRNLQNEARQQ